MYVLYTHHPVLGFRSDPNLVQAEVVCDALLCPSCTTGPLELAVVEDSTTAYQCHDCHCSFSTKTLTKHIQVSTQIMVAMVCAFMLSCVFWYIIFVQIRDEAREMFTKEAASSEGKRLMVSYSLLHYYANAVILCTCVDCSTIMIYCCVFLQRVFHCC